VSVTEIPSLVDLLAERAALRELVAKAKLLSDWASAGGYEVEIYCDVNPEDCDHCVGKQADQDFRASLATFESNYGTVSAAGTMNGRGPIDGEG
jgi:hypothetical protein